MKLESASMLPVLEILAMQDAVLQGIAAALTPEQIDEAHANALAELGKLEIGGLSADQLEGIRSEASEGVDIFFADHK